MPRPARIHLEGALYYVTSRGEPEAPLFRDEQDVRAYLDLLSFYKAQYRFKLYAYTLSPTQVQLCLEVSSGTTISQIMHALNSRYTKIYGKRYSRSGHLFQGRFRATVLEKEPLLAPLTRYLHAQNDTLATSFSQYQRLDSSWLDREDLFRRFTQTQADLSEKAVAEEARKAYGVYVQSAVPEEMEEWRRMLEQPVIGSPDFLRAVEQAKAEGQEPAADLHQDQEEPLLVPAHRTAGTLRKLLSAAAIVGLLYSVGSVAFLSGIVVKQAESNKPVQVVFQAPNAGMQQTSAANVAEPMPVPVMAAPALKELNGTQWQIQIVPMYARNSAAAEEDRITFEGNQIASASLSAQGFPKTNITLTPQEDGRLVWETMQTHPDGETVFWRGELKEGRMQGVFSRHPAGGLPQDYIFRGMPDLESSTQTERTL